MSKPDKPAAFLLVAERRAWWPVTFSGVTEDGDVVEHRFEMRFTVHGQDEFLALMEEGFAISQAATKAANGEGDDAAKPPAFSTLAAQLVEKIASDWRGVAAENSEPLKFEDKHLRALLNVPNVFKAVMDAYKACRAAKKELREGN